MTDPRSDPDGNLNDMTVNFYLREPKKDRSVIQIRVWLFNKPLKFGTGVNIPVKAWNSKKQQIKSTHPRHKILNNILRRKADRLTNIYYELIEEQNLSHENLKARFKTDLKAVKKSTLKDYFDIYIERQKNNPKIRSKNTIDNYIAQKNLLLKYFDHQNRNFNFEEINLEWFYEFSEWFFGPPHYYLTNYGNKVVSFLKAVMRAALEDEAHTNRRFESKKFYIPQDDDIDNVFSDEAELLRVYKSDIPKHLHTTRDLFIIGAFTGQRFGDYSNINPEFIFESEGVKMLKRETQKTGEFIAVPLHPVVVQILDKYNYNLPKSKAHQTNNNELKEIYRLAGINYSVGLERHVKGKKTLVYKKKNEWITTHTARRSAATNMLLSGVEEWQVVKICGWKNEKMLRKIYNKLSKEKIAIMASRNAFFSGKIKSI